MNDIVCSKCKKSKSLDLFTKSNDKNRPSGVQSWCKDCKKERSRIDRISGVQRTQRLMKDYGLTDESYRNIIKSQDYKCVGCKIDLRIYTRIPSIDHCHATGAVRGVLCDACNHALGHVYDDPEVLRRLAVYLEETKTNKVK